MKKLPFPLLYEDAQVLVVDKPAGLLTTHTQLVGRAAREAQPTVENFVNAYVRKGQSRSRLRVWLVHRLDRETSGVLLLVRSQALAEAFRSHWNEWTQKHYVARVVGQLPSTEGVFESYLREDPATWRVASVSDPHLGKLARTQWRVLTGGVRSSLVAITLKSGRKNQIRVHFSEAGHPVVGDIKYGGPKASRMMLHAQQLLFRHPVTEKLMSFSSPVPFN